jgi:Ca2+-binding EF-hand superfamily protein
MYHIIGLGGGHASSAEEVAADALVARIYAALDLDDNGAIDLRELAAGLSVLCGGTPESKLRSAFDAFDVDRDGRLSYPETGVYMMSMIRIFFAVAPESRRHFAGLGKDAKDLARAAARAMFASADANHDGHVTWTEFSAWAKPHFWYVLSDPLALGTHTDARTGAVWSSARDDDVEPPVAPEFLAGPVVGDHDYVQDPGTRPDPSRQLYFPPMPADA